MSDPTNDYLAIDYLDGNEWHKVIGLIAEEFGCPLPKKGAMSAPERVQHLLDAEASNISVTETEWGGIYTKKQATELTRRNDRLARFSEALNRWSASRSAAIAARNSATTASLESKPLDVTVIGRGSVVRNIDSHNGIGGTKITLTARADVGSKFKCWYGDATGAKSTCTVTMDSAKRVSAEFVEFETFGLAVVFTGTGTGKIVRSLDAEQYIVGTKVTLTAYADVGSKFKCWGGDVNGASTTCKVRMDSAKKILAEFVALETFVLNVVSKGTGTGEIVRSLVADQYFYGTNVNLVARADVGSKFKCWHGDVYDQSAACSSVKMNSTKTVIAEFVALESFPLDVTATGTGSGRINRSIDSPSYFADTEVTLTALAEEGSIFNGWHGDVTMMDEAITVTMNSATSISAEFEQLDISETEITAELTSTTRSEVKRGQLATVFSLTLRNNSDQQVRIKVPLTSYVSQSGQTSEQSSWVAGLVNGSKGVTLSAGTFCKIGLVHFKRPAKGDRLYVTVEQTQPSTRICFTFQCIGDWDEFLLISASLENLSEATATKATYPAMASALKRIESLENNLAKVLRRLDAIQQSLPMAGRNSLSNQTGPVQSLSEVWAWVAEHERIGIAELRARLLPLDLLPGAVIDELNERALDLTGELAVEEVGDLILVARDTLREVIANGETGSS